jgi:hypothetical protein
MSGRGGGTYPGAIYSIRHTPSSNELTPAAREKPVEVLYPTTVAVRMFFVACIAWFYVSTCDPVFLVMLAVVVLGVLLTAAGLVLERRKV